VSIAQVDRGVMLAEYFAPFGCEVSTGAPYPGTYELREVEPDHWVNNLTLLYYKQGRYEDAERLTQ
jgi:hypothetical protein